MEWDPSKVVNVFCADTYSPPYVRIVLLDATSYDIPYTFYQTIQEPLGLPDIVCGTAAD